MAIGEKHKLLDFRCVWCSIDAKSEVSMYVANCLPLQHTSCGVWEKFLLLERSGCFTGVSPHSVCHAKGSLKGVCTGVVPPPPFSLPPPSLSPSLSPSLPSQLALFLQGYYPIMTPDIVKSDMVVSG